MFCFKLLFILIQNTELLFIFTYFRYLLTSYFFPFLGYRKFNKKAVRDGAINIRKTCPCSEYTTEPHFYIEKLGSTGVNLFFLFLHQNIDCGYTLEPPRRF